MVQELKAPIAIKIRGSESTISAQGSFIHPWAALDVEVKEMGEEFQLPTCRDEGHDEEDDANSIENAPFD
uniref:Uncharacterized protein n=1 Tax=Cannabis sativa TaxID=3483 RepID=A0A803NJ72_CANSA